MITNITSFYASSFYKMHPENKFYSEWCINDHLKLIFITINKCAGTSLRNYLPNKKNFYIVDNNNNNINIDYASQKINQNYIFYSVIRNPRDRYISGLNWFMYYTNQNNKNFIENNIKNNKFIFDEHLLPQYVSLLKIPMYDKNVNLIKMDDNLSEKISKIINEKNLMDVLNKSKDRDICNYDFCYKMYEKYCHNNENFHFLYKKDFNLYKKSL